MKDSIYDDLIASWTDTLAMRQMMLDSARVSAYGDNPKIIQAFKNAVKRAKWNITRAQNLKKKLEKKLDNQSTVK